ncbi:MAG: diaminopimelate epimerase, partial [Dehalococcoidales bacterium]|nr:diaminopimelate epimerase [Dehalococcoidales bacterium]
MDFTKLEGAGNDFVLVEASDTNRDWSRIAIAVCDRHFGIGGDGLLLLLPSEAADFRMCMFNPDGSEAEACGNGLRCLVKYIIARKLLAGDKAQQSCYIETKGGIRKAIVNRPAGKPINIQVSMGLPKFKAGEIPTAIGESDRSLVDIKFMLNYTITLDNRKLPLNLVSMGNPHAVYFTGQPVADFPLARIGPEVEHHRIFPQRVNFEVARLIDRQQIEARVWERGAGETLACGTGACAIAVAARLNGLTDGSVAI